MLLAIIITIGVIQILTLSRTKTLSCYPLKLLFLILLLLNMNFSLYMYVCVCINVYMHPIMNMLLLQVDQFACIVCILSALQNHRISPQYVELNVGEKLEIRCKGSLDNAKPFWFFDKFLGALNSHYNRTYSIVRYDSVQLYRSGIYTCVGFKGLFSTKFFFAQSIVKVFGK